MKIVVLGGSGFLGSHVCDQLSESRHQVLVFDRVSAPWLRPDQKMIVGYILDENKLEKAINGCNAVYNFAGISDLDRALQQPLETVKANILGNIYY